MSLISLDVADSVTENLGKTMILVGLTLLIVGLLLLNSFGSVLSAGSLFFGVLFLVYGFFVQVGFFSGNLRSLNGLGTVFVCISVAFFAFSVVVIQFLDITVIGYVQEIFHGARLPFFRPLISSQRPYMWLSGLCINLSLVFFVAGLVLKVYHFLKP